MIEELGKIITFYSYKGGTGRSMALANVACLLAQKYHKKVLIIDWDLEAPGLHTYFRNQFNRQNTGIGGLDKWLDNQLGLIDLFWELNEKIQDLNDPSDEDEISGFVNSQEFNIENFIIQTDISTLSLIKAGRFDEHYSTKINEFSWVNFYEQAPSLIPLLLEVLKKKYQYILVDSRTGVTDTSGICTMLIPDTLVVVFTPNRQSLEGVLTIVKKAIDYRKESNDLRPLKVFPLPSRIELSETILRDNWRFGNPQEYITGYETEFEKLFSKAYGYSDLSLEAYFNQVKIQHFPRYSYGEEIAVLIERTGGDRLTITESYENFAERLVNLVVPWDKEESEPPQIVEHSEVKNLCPYRGLESFREEDAQFFFGRKKFIERLLKWLEKHQYLAIFGASSGSGKSSIIQAGLIPKLKLNKWTTCLMTPGEHPLTSLKAAFLSNLNKNQEEDFSQASPEDLNKLIEKTATKEPVFLIIDQLEEIFTLCLSVEEREEFLTYLEKVLEITPSLKLIVGMSSEFFSECTIGGELLQKIKDNRFTVPQMTIEELQEAIIEPAKVVELYFEPELVTQIIEDMKGSSNSLFPLQYTLTQLYQLTEPTQWEKRTVNVFSLKNYSQLGRLKGCLEDQANKVYSGLSDPEKNAAKHIFLTLMQLGEGTGAICRTVFKEDLFTKHRFPNQLIEEVIEKLAVNGLITLNSNFLNNLLPQQNINKEPTEITQSVANFQPLESSTNNKPKLNNTIKLKIDKVTDVTVEVVHEALIRQWDKIKQWVNESRENIQQRSEIEFKASEWRKNNSNSDYLLTRKILKDAQKFKDEQVHDFPLSNLAYKFLEASSEKSKRELIKGTIFVVLLALLGLLPLTYNYVNLLISERRIKEINNNCDARSNCRNLREDLENSIKNNVTLDNVKLRFADLSQGNFSNVQLPKGNFSQANLSQSILFGANLQSSNFSQANLSQAIFQWAILIDANFSNANLQDTIFRSAIMSGAIFDSANLESADFRSTTLIKANFEKANLKNATFQRAYLGDVDFSSANLENVSLNNAYLKGAKFIETKRLTNKQIKSACYWDKAIFNNDSAANQKKITAMKQDKSSDPTPQPDCKIWTASTN